MNVRTILVMLLALICGVAAAVGVMKLRAGTAVAVAQVNMAKVVVAAAEIPRGTTVGPEHLLLKDWPADLIPPGTLTTIEAAVERTVIASTVLKDELLMDAKLAQPGLSHGIGGLIPDGMRAYTINTTSASAGVAGFLLPGNKVDILLTVTGGDEEQTGGGVTATLLQRVEILAVNQILAAPSENKVDGLKSVTLLVTPDQVAKLNLAQTMGSLNLSLRNDGDQLAGQTTPITMKDLRFLEEPPLEIVEVEANEPEVIEQVAAPAPPAKPEPMRIQTYRSRSQTAVYIYPERS